MGEEVSGAAVDDELVSFCRSLHRPLVGSLGLHLGDSWVAEELAQETLLRVCRDWPKVSRMESPRAWAYRVAFNLSRSWTRRRAAERRARQRMTAGAVVMPEVDVAASLAVREAVRALPTRQRQALVLRYYADLSAGEVATLLGCAESTVRSLTAQAVTRLRAAGLVEEVGDVR